MVSFRYIAIPLPEGEIGGFALWYETKNEAIVGFSRFHEYLDLPGNISRSLDVSFVNTHLDNYCLKIVITTDEKIFQTEISDIDGLYVRRLENTLTNYQFYFITAGYTDEDKKEQLLPLSDYNFFRSQIRIGDRILEGTKKNRWPHELFSSREVKISSE